MSGEEKKVDRRNYLKYVGAGIAGLAVGGALGYITAPGKIEKITETVAGPGVTITKTETITTVPLVPKKYTFYYIAWGMADPNAYWHIETSKVYMRINPEVEVKFTGPERYDPAEHVRYLDTVIEAKPDGIFMHISDPAALQKSLMEAKKRGIPIVSVTSHPPQPEAEEILKDLYLCWIGADEYKIGVAEGQRLLKEKTPVHVVAALGHVGHAGAEARAKGFFDVMPKGVKCSKLAIGDEQTRAMEILRSFLKANPDVDTIFNECLFANKWVWDVVEELGRTDKITLLTVDEAPSSIEAILSGRYLATFSQGFPIQGLYAVHVLWVYRETGMHPVGPILTGPIIIDKTTAPQWKKILIDFLGEKKYYELSPWPRE